MADLKCPSGEDIRYLAYCAKSGDWETLTSGLILPEYMDEDAALVAQWVLENEGRQNWPPSYRALRLTFDEIDWPDLEGEDFQGLDPSIAAIDVQFAHKRSQALRGTYLMQQLALTSWAEDSYGDLLREVGDLLSDLRDISSTRKRNKRLGEDPMETYLMMTSPPLNTLTSVRTGLKPLDDVLYPYSPGIYAFFARPKQGKSVRLLRIAWHLSHVEGLSVVLVDPENDIGNIRTRLALIAGDVCATQYRDYLKRNLEAQKQVRPMLKTQEDRRLEDQIARGAEKIAEASSIHLLGKEDIDPVYQKIRLDDILSVQQSTNSKVLLIDQVQLVVHTETYRKNMSDTASLYAAVIALDNLPGIISFVTTQEKREQSGRRGVRKFPHPNGDLVFGGDAIAQKCSFLAHIDRFSSKSEDGDGVTLITPVNIRNASAGAYSRIFLQERFFNEPEVLDPVQGRMVVDLILNEEARAAQQSSDAAAELTRRSSDSSSTEDVATTALRRITQSRQATAAKLVRSMPGPSDEG